MRWKVKRRTIFRDQNIWLRDTLSRKWSMMWDLIKWSRLEKLDVEKDLPRFLSRLCCVHCVLCVTYCSTSKDIPVKCCFGPLASFMSWRWRVINIQTTYSPFIADECFGPLCESQNGTQNNRNHAVIPLDFWELCFQYLRSPTDIARFRLLSRHHHQLHAVMMEDTCTIWIIFGRICPNTTNIETENNLKNQFLSFHAATSMCTTTTHSNVWCFIMSVRDNILSADSKHSSITHFCPFFSNTMFTG